MPAVFLHVIVEPREVVSFVLARRAGKDQGVDDRKRTVVLTGLPVGVDDAFALETALADFGTVERVGIDVDEEGTTLRANVLFKDPEGASQLLNSSGASVRISRSSSLLQGLAQEGTFHHSELTGKRLRQEANDFMARFDEAQLQEEEARKRRKGLPDDDGFITVEPRRRRPGEARTGAERKPAQRATAVLGNFYHFQQHDKKREQLLQMRARFEADKKRIAALRADRKFRPE